MQACHVQNETLDAMYVQRICTQLESPGDPNKCAYDDSKHLGSCYSKNVDPIYNVVTVL